MTKEKKTDVVEEITRQREVTGSGIELYDGFELDINRPHGKGWELISAEVREGEFCYVVVWTWERKR
jgi:hypothetical protein